MNKPRIVFMGTPPFAVASLDALVKAGCDVVGIVTAPDRPAGRGQVLRMSAVKDYALAHPFLRDRILQPEKLRDPDFHQQLDRTGADLYVVVAFRMLPEVVWKKPALGTINLHGSLLPDYRGAAPINWAVINGEQITGATTFFIQQEIDTGDMIDQVRMPIGPDATAGEVHDELMLRGADLLVRTVRSIGARTVRREPQTMEAPTLHHAPKLTPENCRIHFDRQARQVHNLVRGLSPYPGAWCEWHAIGAAPMHFKVLRTLVTDAAASREPGTVECLHDKLIVHTSDRLIELIDVQPEGKKRMAATAFVRGLRTTENITLR